MGALRKLCAFLCDLCVPLSYSSSPEVAIRRFRGPSFRSDRRTTKDTNDTNKGGAEFIRVIRGYPSSARVDSRQGPASLNDRCGTTDHSALAAPATRWRFGTEFGAEKICAGCTNLKRLSHGRRRIRSQDVDKWSSLLTPAIKIDKTR